jgi:hypothetical protein
LLVETVELPRGPWAPPRDAPAPGHLGFLLAAGIVVREVCVAESWSAELLNQGDLLRPWLEDAASFVEWQVVEPATLAVLDPALTARLARWPELVEEFVERAMRRSRSMAVHAAIAGTRRIEDRLLLLFWHLAERWGRREPDGVVLELALTHTTLSHLIGAERPTVTTALGDLAERGALTRTRGGRWLLRGEPPSTQRSEL